jgi:hypothetical protein
MFFAANAQVLEHEKVHQLLNVELAMDEEFESS